MTSLPPDDGSSAAALLDAEEGITDRPWEELARLLEEGEEGALVTFVDELNAGEQALALSRLNSDAQRKVLTTLAPEDAAELISHLSEVQAAELVEILEPVEAAAIVHELPSDEQADLLGDMDQESAEAILEELSSDDAATVRQLTQYDDDVAGGLMVREYLRYRDQTSVKDVLADLEKNADNYRDYEVQYAYLTDRRGKLTGVLRMRDLLLAPRQQPVADIMITDPLSVQATMPLADLVEVFDSHHFLGIPVTDTNGRLQGIIHRKAVEYARSRQSENDYLKSQGIVGGEELRTMPLGSRAKRRLSWLSINILLNVVAASVIAFFQDTLSAVIALAVFLPIISDMSGCSGNQAVAVSMRELSLGLVRPTEILRVLWKEVTVGLVNGAALGFLVALVATLWDGNPVLGLVVGVALFANTLIAVSIGGTVPLVLRRFGFDPAVASGPLLTTVTDMCGFLLVLGLATLCLPYLTAG